ncbi:MAG: NAD(P)H-hydrate dehydratase [Rhodobacteraceae bacterium]|nr:NAD(P)H-hydrate dehydratase [Paracoccaceae bacterium]
MTELLTAAQMRAIEQTAIARGETTGLELMERAGAGVVEAILEEWPEMALTSQKAVVLCGPGNNGGDGFVVARLLKQRGWEVEVFLYGEVEKLPVDAKTNAERWLEMGNIVDVPSGFWLPKCSLHIDALFGTGISRAIPEEISYSFAYLHKRHDHFKAVAIDMPSGLCADSGRPIGGISGKADLTVTFHKQKVGQYIGAGPDYCGTVKSVDIEIPPVFRSVESLMAAINNPNRNRPSDEDIRREAQKSERKEKRRVHLAKLPHARDGLHNKQKWKSGNKTSLHKYAHGHAFILSGPSAHTGAARLAARGALRIGAGVVSLGAPQSAIAECAAQLTAIMLAPIEDGVALEATLQDKRINALCLGPALGLDERAEGLVTAAVGASTHPTVLDADALTILARRPDLFAKLHKNCVLTPHAGEFKRLFPDIMAKLDAPALTGPAYSKVDATREAAALAGCVVLFKGADTVIAAPDGRAAINSAHYERAAPWLATAGSGDVLAGFITGLLARGFAPMQAAETAAWLHVECALNFGAGLIAEDIPEQLPAVFKALSL